MLDSGDLSTIERCTESGRLVVEKLIAAFPILTAYFEPSLQASLAFEWKEASTDIQLHAEESCIASALPWPIWLPIQGAQKPACCISAGESLGVQPRSYNEVWPICKR
jgi:hypothetical protein